MRQMALASSSNEYLERPFNLRCRRSYLDDDPVNRNEGWICNALAARLGRFVVGSIIAGAWGASSIFRPAPLNLILTMTGS